MSMCCLWWLAPQYRSLLGRQTETTHLTKLQSALDRLRKADRTLQQREQLLEKRKSDHERNLVEIQLRRRTAVRLMSDSQKRHLKAEVRRRRMCELSLQKLTSMRGMIEQQIMSINDGETMGMALNAMKSGIKMSSAQQKRLDNFDVDEMMEQFLESNDVVKHIQEALASTATMDETMSDEQALAELERLIERDEIATQFVTDDTIELLQGLPGVPEAVERKTDNEDEPLEPADDDAGLIIEAL